MEPYSVPATAAESVVCILVLAAIGSGISPVGQNSLRLQSVFDTDTERVRKGTVPTARASAARCSDSLGRLVTNGDTLLPREDIDPAAILNGTKRDGTRVQSTASFGRTVPRGRDCRLMIVRPKSKDAGLGAAAFVGISTVLDHDRNTGVFDEFLALTECLKPRARRQSNSGPSLDEYSSKHCSMLDPREG